MDELAFLKQQLENEIKARQAAESALEEKERELTKFKKSLGQSYQEILVENIKSESLLTSAEARLSSLIMNLNSAILLEDEKRKILLVNQKFCDLFGIPVAPELLIGSDCSGSAEQSKVLFKEPQMFIERIEELLTNKANVIADKLELVDGRVLNRDFIPVFQENEYLGHLWTYDDVTDVVLANKKLESLSRFPKESPNPILRCTKDGDILYSNVPSRRIVIALTNSTFNVKNDQARIIILEKLKEAYKTRVIVKTEVKVSNKIYELIIVPVENEEYINIYGRDVSEIKTAENKIQLLKELLNQFDEFIQILDKEGNFIFANKMSANRFGYDGDEILGMNIQDVTSNFYEGMTWDEQFDFFREKKKFVFENTYFNIHDNLYHPIEASIKHTSINGKEYLISFSKDITERKNIQEALRRQKEFYEDILNQFPTDIAVFNKDFQYIYINHAAIKNDELRAWIIGKTDLEYCIYRGRDLSIAETRLNRLKEVVNHKKSIIWEDVINGEDGNEIYHLRRVEPLLDDSGNVKFIIGYGLNITERKKIEEELIKANKIAEESMRAKETFLANMSHEIRTPMNGILGMAQLLEKTVLTSNQANYLRLIKNSADNLLIIINDVLDLAKIQSGKFSLEQIPFNITETIKNAIQSLTYKAEEKGIDLILLPFDEEINTVIGDPFRLNQILINLINNAIKFTENGFVEITVRVPQRNDAEITYEFLIKDTGIGIPQDKIDSIFEGFAQASTDTTRIYGGTGLGLTICKDLIEMQDGHIWVESTPEVGSTFIFSLTYKKGDVSLHVNHKELIVNDYTSIGELNILLAEDNEVNQYLATTILNEWSFHVDIANNGLEALKLIEMNNYDIVLMDIRMPHMGGIEATDKIRNLADPQKANVPIIALTANALVGDEDKYINAGMNDYLSKPFEKEKLFNKISKNVKIRLSIEPDFSSTVKSEVDENATIIDFVFLEKSFNNNHVVLNKIINIFIDTTPAILDDLISGLEQRDCEKIYAAAHKLKTTIDSFKIRKLQEIVRKVESNAESKSKPEDMPHLISVLVEVMKMSINEANTRLKNYN